MLIFNSNKISCFPKRLNNCWNCLVNLIQKELHVLPGFIISEHDRYEYDETLIADKEIKLQELWQLMKERK